jgi:aminoglycoside phosphotransferase (APT) family kinase protein
MAEMDEGRWAAALAGLSRAGADRDAEPAVVRDGLSLLVRQGDALVRVRPRAQEPVAAREVEVANALGEAEVPVVATRGVRQPWVIDGWVVTGWQWVEANGEATPADLGGLARQLRERTVDTYVYDVARFDPLTAARNAVAALPIGDEQGDFVRRRAQELSADWARIADRDPAGTGVVHGDLHGDNVLIGPDGPVLTDLELAGAGPASYDTAPAVVAVERYGADPATLDAFLDAQGLDPRAWAGFATCRAVYELWVTAWAVGVRDRSPELAEEAATRVSCLRDQACVPWHLH